MDVSVKQGRIEEISPYFSVIAVCPLEVGGVESQEVWIWWQLASLAGRLFIDIANYTLKSDFGTHVESILERSMAKREKNPLQLEQKQSKLQASKKR